MIKLKAIAALLAVAAANAWLLHMSAAEPTDKPLQLGNVRADLKDTLTPAEFQKLQALIKPKPGGYDDVPWMTDLWTARKTAAAEGKPLLVWVGDGHPLGWT